MNEPKRYEDIDDDEDERENEQLESSGVQAFTAPLYLVILVVGIMVGIVPFSIIYTIIRMIMYYS